MHYMNTPLLIIKTRTWLKDSHSLFDYQTYKIEKNLFENEAGGTLVVYRQKNGPALKVTRDFEVVDKNSYDFLTEFAISRNTLTNSLKLKFRKYNSQVPQKQERANTEESNQGRQAKEDPYIIVNYNNSVSGVRLNVGKTLKLGRVEYFVSEVSFKKQIQYASSKVKHSIFNRAILNVDQYHEKRGDNCKICLQDFDLEENYLINPCKCAGSCGTVHVGCLQEWIKIKVKKLIIGGTIHLNFQKFQCEVCKAEFPMVIDRAGKLTELLPLEKPKGTYLILEAACEKTKSVMLLQNLGEEGIKLGRGHECEIRIQDISVSRNHALIKLKEDGFYVYDNRSKFGTLVREDNFDLDVAYSTEKQAIQIGRTVFEFEIGEKKLS